MKEPVILCVDDEELVLQSLKRELTKAFGSKYLIEVSDSGEDALKLFEELQEDGYEIPLVISDHIMPDMKGDELLRLLHERSPNTLKIMLTGQADMEAVTNAVNQANLYRYISKPWEATDLELTIKEAVRRYFQDKALEKQITLLRNMNSTLELKVKERTAQLETQKIQLKQLNLNKDTLFSIIAEDLRTPFTGLLGITDFIVNNVEKFRPEEIKEHVSSMRESTENVYMLLENLLTWAQFQQGKLEFEPQMTVLHELAQRNVAFFASNAAKKQISLTNQIPKDLNVFVDKATLSAVIRNLVSNALKFTSQGGVIALAAQAGAGYIDCSISDTGVGISKDDFTNLFRSDVKYSTPGTDGEEGTGLGLILCKMLVEKNGGRIQVESEPGQGSVFTVRLLKEMQAS